MLASAGAVAGALIAALVMLVRSRITDPVLESVVALVTPYAAYVAGTALRVSGVTAVIVAGLIIGAAGPGSPPPPPGCRCTRSTKR